MRIHVVLDEDLMKSALHMSGLRTKKDAIEKGLTLLVDVHRHKKVTAVIGKLERIKRQ